MRSVLALLLLASTPLAPVQADEPTPSVAAQVQAYFKAENADDRAAIALGLTLRGTPPAKVRSAIAGARTWPAATDDAGHVTGWKRKSKDGAEHTIFARLPASYDPAKAWPVMVWLHGGVSRTEDGGGAYGANSLGERADAHGFIVVSPSTYGKVPWWSADGVALVHGALEDAKARWHVDTNRVYLTGFSDGASGCFHMLAHDPEPYAAFLPFMGHPALTRMMGGPTYAANVTSRPVWAVNGGLDRLYPSSAVKPLIEGLKQAGCDITWTDLPQAGHSLTAVAQLWDELWTFVQAHPRTPSEPTKQLACFDPARGGRLDWVEVVRVSKSAPGDAKRKPVELAIPRRVVLGIRGDLAYDGPGFRLSRVEGDTPAADAGLLAGDVIVKIGDVTLGSGAAAMAALRAALTIKDGATELTLSMVIEREGAKQTVEVTAGLGSRGPRPPELGFDVPAARIEARRISRSRIEVATFNVGAFRLHLSPQLVDLDKPLVVMVNGKQRFAAVPTQDVAYMLDAAWRGGGAKPHYAASILIRVE